MSAEQAARRAIDEILAQAGWAVQDFKQAEFHAVRGVAIRKFVLNEGSGSADHLLYVDGKAAGVIEARKQGATLTGVENVHEDRFSEIALGDPAERAKHTLARVYEYFLSHFATAESKKGGQIHTPTNVVRVLIEMLSPSKGRVCDPSCGSGGMFVKSENPIEDHPGLGPALT